MFTEHVTRGVRKNSEKKTLQCSVWNASSLTKCDVPTTIRDVWTSVLIDCAMVKQTRSITVSGVHSSSMSVHSASPNPKKTKKLKDQKTKNTKKTQFLSP